MLKLRLCKYSTKTKERRLRGFELLVDGSSAEIQIHRCSNVGDLVSHGSFSDSRSLSLVLYCWSFHVEIAVSAEASVDSL